MQFVTAVPTLACSKRVSAPIRIAVVHALSARSKRLEIIQCLPLTDIESGSSIQYPGSTTRIEIANAPTKFATKSAARIIFFSEDARQPLVPGLSTLIITTTEDESCSYLFVEEHSFYSENTASGCKQAA